MPAVPQPLIATETLTLDDLRAQLRKQPSSLYAILDACDEPRVPVKVQELGPQRAVSLYRGQAERDYWAIAPYLVQIDEQLLDWIAENLWDAPWGIFATSSMNLAAVRQHFRRFLIVEDPNKEPMYFRFYDPRVLPIFLKTCEHDELSLFFGAIGEFLLSEEKSQLISLSTSVSIPKATSSYQHPFEIMR